MLITHDKLTQKINESIGYLNTKFTKVVKWLTKQTFNMKLPV